MSSRLSVFDASVNCNGCLLVKLLSVSAVQLLSAHAVQLLSNAFASNIISATLVKGSFCVCAHCGHDLAVQLKRTSKARRKLRERVVAPLPPIMTASNLEFSLLEALLDHMPLLLYTYWTLASGAAAFALSTTDLAPRFRCSPQ